MGCEVDFEGAREGKGSLAGVPSRWKIAALESASEGIVLTDPREYDNPIVYVNSGFTRITGYRAGEVIGRNCRFLRGQGTDTETTRALRAALARGEGHECEILNYRKDGSAFVNQLHITPVHDAAGCLTHFVGIQLDVTAQRDAEARERRAHLELASARKFAALGEMAAGVAHEINNPMTIVTGRSHQLTCLLEEMENAVAAGERVPRSAFASAHALNADIRDAAFRSARIAASLLSFTGQAGRGTSTAPVELEDLVEGAIARLRDKAYALGVEVTFEGAGEASCVRVDTSQVATAVGNLVDNAIDAAAAARASASSSSGEAWVSVRVLQRRGMALIEVSDSGPVLPDDTAERVFHPFFTTKGPGRSTGLGLCVARGFAERNNGGLELDRASGRNVFRLTLGLAEESGATAHAREGAGAFAPARGSDPRGSARLR